MMPTRDSRFTRGVMGTGLHNPENTDEFVSSNVSQPPPPGSEVAGPALFDLVRELRTAQAMGERLLKDAAHFLGDKRIVIAYANGQTDAAGLLDLPVYTVPGGYEFATTRWNIEAVGFTPATPYTNAAGWIALVRGSKFGVGGILDFLPNPPVASGAIIPAAVTDGADSAAVVRSGEIVSLHIQGGPASTDVYVRLQGMTRPV